VDDAFFKAAYEKDEKNKGRQTWAQYQDWVKTFYEGKRFPPVSGWNDREKDILAKVPEARDALQSMGRLLASEWAKDNGARKVSTSDLQAWGGRFKDARDPASLLAALQAVEAEISRR
jgi:hypothetical protein